MEALRADWRESLARFEKEGAEARAEAAKERAEDRAENKAAIEKLRTDMERNSKYLMAFIVLVVGLAVAVLKF